MTISRKTIQPINTFNGNLKYHNNDAICYIINPKEYDPEDIDVVPPMNDLIEAEMEVKSLNKEIEHLNKIIASKTKHINHFKDKLHYTEKERWNLECDLDCARQTHSKSIYNLRKEIDDWKMKCNGLSMENQKLKKIVKANLYKPTDELFKGLICTDQSGKEKIIETEMTLNRVFDKISGTNLNLSNNIKNNIKSFVGDDSLYDTNSDEFHKLRSQLHFARNHYEMTRSILNLPNKFGKYSTTYAVRLRHLKNRLFQNNTLDSTYGDFQFQNECNNNSLLLESYYWRRARSIETNKKEGGNTISIYFTQKQIETLRDYEIDYYNFTLNYESLDNWYDNEHPSKSSGCTSSEIDAYGCVNDDYTNID